MKPPRSRGRSRLCAPEVAIAYSGCVLTSHDDDDDDDDGVRSGRAGQQQLATPGRD